MERLCFYQYLVLVVLNNNFILNRILQVFRKSEFLHFHTFKCHPQKELASEMVRLNVIFSTFCFLKLFCITVSLTIIMKISDIDGESGTKLAIRGKTSTPRKRRIARNFNEEDEEYPTNLSKRRGLVKEEQGERREQTQHIYMDKKGESSRSSKRQFTLEELKYADFLQPKVVLSKSLSVIITQMMSESERSTTCNNAIVNLWFHNYAKPCQF